MWQEALTDLHNIGKGLNSRVGQCTEIVGWSGVLTDITRNFLMNTRRRLSPMYACAELVWYLSGEQTIDRIKAYAPQYVKFADEHGVAYGAYGHRLKSNIPGLHQLWLLLRVLREQSKTRQAVITMWKPADLHVILYDTPADVPCTLTWQFLVRDGRLHMVCSMRSNDVWLGMPYDIFVNTSIQSVIADTLGIEYGTYTHHVGSLHLYEKNATVATEAMGAEPNEGKGHGWEKFSDLRDMDMLCADEALLRSGKHIIPWQKGSLFNDVLACLATKWDVKYPLPYSPDLLRGLQQCSS